MPTKLVVIESPYAGNVGLNVAYARAALVDSLHRGEFPIASHLLYTQPGVLDDDNPEERQLGINAGLAWAEHAQLTAVYVDLGISAGMHAAMRRSEAAGRLIETRRLPAWEAIGRQSPEERARAYVADSSVSTLGDLGARILSGIDRTDPDVRAVIILLKDQAEPEMISSCTVEESVTICRFMANNLARDAQLVEASAKGDA